MKVLFVGLTLVFCIGVGKWSVTVKWDLIRGQGVSGGGWRGLAKPVMSAVLSQRDLGVICSESTPSREKSLPLFSALPEWK